MRNGLRGLAISYAAILAILAAWAWHTDITLLHSEREHLLPDVLFAFATAPSSFLVSPLYEKWPDFFTVPFVQLAALTLCGVIQAGGLFMLSRPKKADDEL